MTANLYMLRIETCINFPRFLFLASPTFTMAHLRAMLNMYWTPLKLKCDYNEVHYEFSNDTSYTSHTCMDRGYKFPKSRLKFKTVHFSANQNVQKSKVASLLFKYLASVFDDVSQSAI
jgi:hypothetical protein